MTACLVSAVPPAGVYLVKLASSAAIAARLMLSGVGKSGSPAEKSTTSTPSRRSLSASAMTFMVDETLMREMRSAVEEGLFCVICLLRNLNSRPKALLDEGRNQPQNIPAERDDFLHEPRADEGESFTSEKEDGFKSGLQAAIHQSHLQLVLVIGNGAYSAQDGIGIAAHRIVCE